jgi:hypothetical protein
MDNLESKRVKYNWKINDSYFTHSQDSNKNKITLANDVKNFVNRIKISLEIVNRKRILQSLLEQNFSINFVQRKNDDSQKFFSQGKFKEEASFFDSF